MKREEIIAQAFVSWIDKKLITVGDIARDNVPMLDVNYLLRSLANLSNFPANEVSMSLAGFGVDATTLRSIANEYGLLLKDIADDFNAAAAWRNSKSSHPKIIALAYGKQPGVHTLKHFAQPQSRDLAETLLRWASENELFCYTGAQKELLQILADSERLERLRTLDTIADFLSAWSNYRDEDPNDAPRKALPQLGLVSDPSIFHNLNELENRLTKNLELTTQIIDTAPAFIRQRRRNIERYNNIEIRDSLLEIIDKVELLRLDPSAENRSQITLDDLLKVFKPPVDTINDENELVDDNSEDDDNDSENKRSHSKLDLSDITIQSASFLLDNKQEDLDTIVKELQRALKDGEENGSDEVEGEIPTDEGNNAFNFKIDNDFLGWLHTFCNKEVWGGLIVSKEPSLESALKHFTSAVQDPIFLSPLAITPDENGEYLSLEKIFQLFDKEFENQGLELGLARHWSRFCELRIEIIDNLDYLMYFPLTWLSGKPELAEKVEEYLTLSGEIYRIVQENYRIMSDQSDGYAKTVLEGLLALDVVQVQQYLDNGKISHKAILLPTHPLHLWRYQRMAALLRGLGTQIEPSDREAILKEINRPDQFLSVLWIGSIPKGRGAEQILPISNEIYDLATFENLYNAISGPDGIDGLVEIVERFAILAPYHTHPLRLAIVNPPEPGVILTKLTKILDRRRESTISCLRIEFFCTNHHKHRIQQALRLSDERELFEDKIASGRLVLRYHSKPFEMNEILNIFNENPFHIIAIFDEASIYIRRRSIEQALPMSPFCVRRQIRVDRFKNTVELVPTSDDPPFSEYIQLINEAQRGQRDSTPHAWAEVENLRNTIDQILQSDVSSHWVFLADRASLTEGRMKSVCLVKRREGKRQVLLAAPNYERLADLLKPVFVKCNLSISSQKLQVLLSEGVNLIGKGFLNLVRAKDGKPDINRVRGIAGMLLAARDYYDRYPNALLVCVDNEITRLWLRLGKKSNERCDLLGLRKLETGFIFDCIEVKTTESDSINENSERIAHAQKQIISTLEACSRAINDNIISSDPLTAPRCEMLKEIFVRACQTSKDETRKYWSDLLCNIFKQGGNSSPVYYNGEIVKVLLLNNGPVTEKILVEQPYKISIRNLTESRLQELLEDIPRGDTEESISNNLANEKQNETNNVVITPQNNSITTEVNNGLTNVDSEEIFINKPNEDSIFHNNTNMYQIPFTAECSNIEDETWPPPVNHLGMIGQYEVVSQLIAQVNFCRASGRRFSDKLLVGSAGVGKSSLARAISRKLLGEEEILFNGADLRQPSMIINKLRERGKIRVNPQNQPIKVEKCLIFIDEVHAIHHTVATALLSAMDDQRITTIDGKNYDFNDVIFILATTDSGKLSEAFNSRPDKLILRPYTLYELAGIVWLHGKKVLEGNELSKEVCIEIAARMRCQPRRAVRVLSQLIPYFHSITHDVSENIDYSRIAQAMTQEAVASWFDNQNIDYNGLDIVARNYLMYLKRNGATAERRLMQALGISNTADFNEVDEYLNRLGLVSISTGGRILTPNGRKYLNSPFNLRDKISRQIL